MPIDEKAFDIAWRNFIPPINRKGKARELIQDYESAKAAESTMWLGDASCDAFAEPNEGVEKQYINIILNQNGSINNIFNGSSATVVICELLNKTHTAYRTIKLPSEETVMFCGGQVIPMGEVQNTPDVLSAASPAPLTDQRGENG